LIVYYDSVGLIESTKDGGYIDPSGASQNYTFSTIDTTFSNETRSFGSITSDSVINFGWNTQSLTDDIYPLTDNNDSLPSNIKGYQYGGVRYSLGSAKQSDFVAFKLTEDSLSNTFKIYGASSAAGAYTQIATSSSLEVGWNIVTFSTANYQYYVIQFEGSASTGSINSNVKVTEVIIGLKLDINLRYTSDTRSIQPLNIITESYTGKEYSTRTNPPKSISEFNWESIPASLKTSLESVRDKDTILIYDTDYHFGLLSGLDINEVAHNRYSTSLSVVS
jgi:hypothetical protein